VGSDINAPTMPPGGITPEMIMMIAQAVVALMTGGVGATGPSTQEFDSRQAGSSTTSRDPIGTGSHGGVDAGWKRTNPLSKDGSIGAKRRPERCGKPAPAHEPAGAVKTQASPKRGAALGSAVGVQDPPRPYSKGGNIEDPTKTPIVKGGNQSHDAEKANRRDRRAAAANASQSSTTETREELPSKRQHTTSSRSPSPVLRSPAEWKQRRLERKASAAKLAEPELPTEGDARQRSETQPAGKAKPPRAPAKGKPQRWKPVQE